MSLIERTGRSSSETANSLRMMAIETEDVTELNVFSLLQKEETRYQSAVAAVFGGDGTQH